MARISILEQRAIAPTNRVGLITDFDQLVRLFPQWEGRIEQLTCGRFEAHVAVRRGRQIHVHAATGNQAIHFRGRDAAGLVSLGLVLPESSGCIWQRRHLDPGSLVLRSGSVEVDHRTSKRTGSLNLIVSEAMLREAANSITHSDPGPISWLAVRAPQSAFKSLEARLRRFLGSGSGHVNSETSDNRAFEQSCIVAAIEALFPAASSRRVELRQHARTHLVRRAEDVMRRQFNDPVGEVDLCSELGVSGRTLRLAFRERFGLGPMTYYQTLRLNAARNALKVSRSESVSIAMIARNLGFTHLGKFAGYYRRQFGELPSATFRTAFN